MKYKLIISRSLTVMLVLFLISCAGTKLTSAYKNEKYEGRHLKKVMIVAVSDNLKTRSMFENVFVKEFEQNGVAGISSLDALSADTEPSKDLITGEAKRRGVDAIFMTYLAGSDEKYVRYSPTVIPRNEIFSNAYLQTYTYTRVPEYYSKLRYVRLESRIYDAVSETLIWSVSTETIDPKSIDDTIESLCKIIMKNLKENDLIR
jgi:hypothetical protein